jgi:hypothetical protein
MNATTKRTLIQILFGVIIVLLLANHIYKKYIMIKMPSENTETSSKLVEEKFLSSVNSFGLKKSWVTKTKFKSSSSHLIKQDSSIKSFKISVPQDLPIPVILNEISSSLKNENVDIVSEEEKINGKTMLSIFSKENLKLAALFEYNSETRRKAGYVGVIISGLEELKEDEISQILNFPELFGYYIIPSKESAKFVKNQLKSKKECIILLNDDIEELKFKLQNDYPKSRLKSSIRSIIGSFPKAAVILVDDKSNFYKSSNYKFVESEFVKRNIKLIKESKLIDITGEAKSQLQSTFRNLVKSVNENWGKVIIVPADNFSIIEDEVIKLRKIGYRFINPSQILLNTN